MVVVSGGHSINDNLRRRWRREREWEKLPRSVRVCKEGRGAVRRREGEEGYFRAHCQPALNYDITVLGLTAAGQGKGEQHSFLFHPCSHTV